MGRKKRGGPDHPQPNEPQQHQENKKPKTEESYLVKKYRAEKETPAMVAFVKYTKSHRMLDASYVRCAKGVTVEKPFVFSTRTGGVDLGWGRGKTREAAMDCACRAAFALVSAHGYNNFPLDDDCLLQEPVDAPLPPPPPPPPPLPASMVGSVVLPPLPPGLPPLPGGVPPPLPPGLPPSMMGLPPLPLPPAADLIPQPKVASSSAPVASSLATTASNNPMVASINNGDTIPQVLLSLHSTESAATPSMKQKKLKGGLTLVYDPESEGSEEYCMEEKRASLVRYQKLLLLATTGSIGVASR